jgi:signal transduction histidine kinase
MRRQLLIDVGVAVAAFAGTLVLMFVPESDEAHAARDPDALGVALAALASLPLVARRRAPLLVFVFVAVASSVLFNLGYPEGPPLGPTVALYFLALSRTEGWPRTAPIIGLVAALFAVHITALGLGRDDFPGGELLLGTILWSGVWIAGDRTRLRRERMAALEERALRAERDAERERQLAAAEERTRIARDLHDSAGHAINVILVQAGAARLLQERDPERAREALHTIEEVARETIGEIDKIVGALREDGSSADIRDEVDPPSGLAGLETLVERQRGAGLTVSVNVDGTPRSLARSVDQAAYRILQEALTNATRYGGGSAELEVRYAPRALELTVSNPLSSESIPSTSANGHGIAGMHERAALLGGTLSARAEDRVFRVRARLPYRQRAGA